jgi:hypothetical protein
LSAAQNLLPAFERSGFLGDKTMLENAKSRVRLLAVASILSSVFIQYPNEARADLLYAAVKDVSIVSGVVTYGVETFDENHNPIGQVTGTPSPTGGFAAGSDGDFYIAAGNTITQFDATGKILNTFAASGQATIQRLSFAQGNLYAAIFDPSNNLSFVEKLDKNLNSIGQLPDDSSVVGGFAANTEGDLYSADGGHTITKYDVDLNFFFPFDTLGFGGGLIAVTDLSFGGGKIYAAINEVDPATGVVQSGVQAYDDATFKALISLVQSSGPSLGIEDTIFNLAADSAGNFYTATGLTDHIFAYGPNGKFLGLINASTLGPPDDFSILSIEALSTGVGPTEIAVPEPTALALLAVGLVALGFMRWTRIA